MVSTVTIVFIIVNMVLGVAIPIALLVYFKKKYKTGIKSFLVGCAVMFLFALVLAILLHAVLDGVAVLTAKSGMSLIAVEAIVWLLAIGIALIARNIWKRENME